MKYCDSMMFFVYIAELESHPSVHWNRRMWTQAFQSSGMQRFHTGNFSSFPWQACGLRKFYHFNVKMTPTNPNVQKQWNFIFQIFLTKKVQKSLLIVKTKFESFELKFWRFPSWTLDCMELHGAWILPPLITIKQIAT